MNTIVRILMTVLAWVAISAATAEAQGPGGQGHRPPKPPIDLALDANSNDIIDADEIANAVTALATLDSDGDGALSASECLPSRRPGAGGQDRRGQSGRESSTHQGGRPGGAGGQGQGPPKPPLFTALDADSDGLISADEIANAPAALSSLDSDGDGKLTATEHRPPPPQGRGGPGGANNRSGQGNS